MSFKGTLNDTSSTFYRFASEDRRMHTLGLGSYSEPGIISIANNEASRADFVNTLLYPCKMHLEEDVTEDQAMDLVDAFTGKKEGCLLYTSPSPRDVEESRMPSSA